MLIIDPESLVDVARKFGSKVKFEVLNDTVAKNCTSAMFNIFAKWPSRMDWKMPGDPIGRR